MRLSPKLIVVLVSALLVVIVAIFVFQAMQPASQTQGNVPPQKVNITLSEGAVLDIYQSNDGALHGDGAVTTDGEPVTTVNQNQEIQLNQGIYVIQTRDEPDYKPFSEFLIVGQDPVELNITREYTDKKLQSLLGGELPAIRQAIASANPKINQYYNLEPGWLYKQGDWYATKLVYKGGDVNQTDTLRLVAHKKDGTWQLVTTPPDITISGPKYPQIPQEILTDINNFR